MYYIGIDGGGSTSRLLAVDKHLTPIGRNTGGPTNLAALPAEVVGENIRRLIEEFNAKTNTHIKDCEAICIGTAGADGDRNTAVMEKIFRDIGFTGKIKIVTDAVIALASKTKGKAGIVIISGTGSIGYAIDESGQASRCGGWGAFIDDSGSGYKIGMEAIRYALMDFDGRGQKTALTSKIIEFFELKRIDEVLKQVYSIPFDKAKIAKLSQLVRTAAQEGDTIALLIENTAAEDLALLAKTLISKSQLFAAQVILSGSILLNNQHIQDRFKQKVIEAYPNVTIAPQDVESELGAVYLAMQS